MSNALRIVMAVPFDFIGVSLGGYSVIEITNHTDGDTQTIGLKGRLEFGDCPEASQVLDAFNADDIKRIVINLSELEFLDSAGVGLLIGFNKSAIEKGKVMALEGATGPVKELVDLFQLDTVFEIR